ncbi:hypothetical protein ACGGZK_07850 [Agromyces sp. MMS24-K17]|uniref:hypothetical protein n=1 Tax=Agromyces sp. MMS24-K17 TaxID=3372850 RepID=UPI003753EB7A
MNTSPRPTNHRLGLPLLAIIGLGALAAVRGVLHDVNVIQEGQLINLAFVFVPLVVWVVVAVAWSTRPFLSLLAAGGVYGVLLGITHIALWDVNIATSGIEAPALGGNLEGVLAPWLEAVVLRGASAMSSIVVGLVVGALCGLLAWLIRRAWAGVRAARA